MVTQDSQDLLSFNFFFDVIVATPYALHRGSLSAPGLLRMQEKRGGSLVKKRGPWVLSESTHSPFSGVRHSTDNPRTQLPLIQEKTLGLDAFMNHFNIFYHSSELHVTC